jgi:hypothetical protein
VFELAIAFASIGFGDLVRTGKLTRLDPECLGEGADGARGWSGPPVFEACDRQRMHAGSPSELGLRQEMLQPQASQGFAKCHVDLGLSKHRRARIPVKSCVLIVT